ncbi:MAG TPA: peptide ABC transporter substrate-binding protein [Chloroflexi bacterium]|nr:peptide ABC transporter substrate-binding protein [Chloroflexota bacterium]
MAPTRTAATAATPTEAATATPQAMAPTGGTLVVAISSDPSTLNPGISTGFDVHVVADSMFNGLVGLDANANPVPDLADSWDVGDDGRVYTFHLHPGVQWHDGQPFTSADVKFSFEEVLLKYHSRTKAGLENVLDTIETPDENTVVFRFKEPYAPLLQRLDVTEAPILPKHIYEGTDPQTAEANLKPIGTGPFTFESYTQGEEVRLARNEHYFKAGLPHLDEVVFRIIPEDSTQLAALEQGEVDYVWRVPGPDIAHLSANPEMALEQVASGPGGGYCIMTLTFNLERPIFQDLQVRQAFAHAINREQLLEQVQFGQGRVATSPISSQIAWAHIDPEPRYDYSPEKANQLLDEAGHSRGADGTRFKVDIVHFPAFNRWSEVMRENLAEVGIDLEIRPLDRNAAVETIFTKRDFDTNLISYCNNQDPEIGVRRMYVSDNIGPIPFSNGAAYKNPHIDELFDQAASTADREKRATAYAEIQRILKTDLPYWWLVETDFTVGYRVDCRSFQTWSGHFAETANCQQG